jgi:ketopantoate reductase
MNVAGSWVIAGSVGCFVGGMLAKGGHKVGLLAREHLDVAVPLSRRVLALIKRAELEGKGPPGLTAAQIRSA